ncbi:MAG: type IV pilus secretin PilQ [Coxiellaceae bacterium]|nr:type IV pilus secretin PilQ [Coxiellaceae bacterium]
MITRRLTLASSMILSMCISCGISYAGAADKTAGYSSTVTLKARPLSPSGYAPLSSSKKITLNFQNIETRKLLQILAQFSHSNFVISDEVKGSMSIHLKDVPWTQALRVILKSQGLSRQQVGRITMIGPIDAMAAREIKELEVHQKIEQLEPQTTALVHLNYSKAKDIVEMLKKENVSLLSSRGQVSYDERTNTVWLKDNVARIAGVKSLIRRLDQPVKQVEIEARMVTLDKPYEKEFGSRFGLTISNHLSGKFAGANQIASGINVPEVTPITDRLNFNLPATTLFASPATIALAALNFGSFFLDSELSAMEKEGHAEIIGSPRVITSDQHEAHIQEGQEIPYQASTSSGATNIEFKNATLSLTVKPQVTPDNRVILTMKVTRDKVATGTVSIDGQQVVPIDTEEESSQVLLNNGQTVVLGGVFTHTSEKIVEKVPWLGDLPIVGFFFRHTQIRNNKKELLVFLTPRIINNPNQLNHGIKPKLTLNNEDREEIEDESNASEKKKEQERAEAEQKKHQRQERWAEYYKYEEQRKQAYRERERQKKLKAEKAKELKKKQLALHKDNKQAKKAATNKSSQEGNK